MKKFLIFLTAVVAILATACNDEDKKEALVPVANVRLEPTESTVAPGVNMTLRATITPSNATNKKLLWTSSNDNVASVDSAGILSTLQSGNVTVTVATVDGGFTDTRSFEIKNVPVTGIELSETEIVLAPGAKKTLTANILSAAATNKNVIWSSDNEAVATIGANTGELDVRSVGEAIITATSAENNAFFATCTVKAEFVNLLLNPGFEEQGASFTAPLGWTVIPAAWFNTYYANPGNMAQYLATTSNRIGLINANGGSDPFFTANGQFFAGSLSGNFAARVEANRPGGFYQLVNVTPGGRYGFSLTVGYRRNNEAQMSIKTNETIKILSPEGVDICPPTPIITDPSIQANIIQVVGEVTIPEGVTQIRFQFDQLTFANPDQSPLMLVDNCEFVQLPTPE